MLLFVNLAKVASIFTKACSKWECVLLCYEYCLCIHVLTITAGKAHCPISGEIGSSLHLLRTELESNLPGDESPCTWDLHLEHDWYSTRMLKPVNLFGWYGSLCGAICWRWWNFSTFPQELKGFSVACTVVGVGLLQDQKFKVRLTLFIMCRSIKQTSHPMLFLCTQKK